MPLVYDAHHHRCKPDGLSVAEATAGPRRHGEAGSRTSTSPPRARGGRHHPAAPRGLHRPADFPAGWRRPDVTVDVEAKAKERAVVRVMAELARPAASRPAPSVWPRLKVIQPRRWPHARHGGQRARRCGAAAGVTGRRPAWSPAEVRARAGDSAGLGMQVSIEGVRKTVPRRATTMPEENLNPTMAAATNTVPTATFDDQRVDRSPHHREEGIRGDDDRDGGIERRSRSRRTPVARPPTARARIAPTKYAMARTYPGRHRREQAGRDPPAILSSQPQPVTRLHRDEVVRGRRKIKT